MICSVKPSVHSVTQHNDFSQRSITIIPFNGGLSGALAGNPPGSPAVSSEPTYSKWQLVPWPQCSGALIPGPHMNNGTPVQPPSCSCRAAKAKQPLHTDNTLRQRPANRHPAQRVAISHTPAHLLPGPPDLWGRWDDGCKAKDEAAA